MNKMVFSSENEKIQISMGEKLRYLRIKRQKTLREQGKIWGVSSNAVYKWEHDLAKPREAALEKIAAFYGVPAEWLLDENVDAKDIDRL